MYSSLTKEQSDDLEDIQKRACKIAVPNMGYQDALSFLTLKSLSERRFDLCKTFFDKIQSPSDKLNKLLPKQKVVGVDRRDVKD